MKKQNMCLQREQSITVKKQNAPRELLWKMKNYFKIFAHRALEIKSGEESGFGEEMGKDPTVVLVSSMIIVWSSSLFFLLVYYSLAGF